MSANNFAFLHEDESESLIIINICLAESMIKDKCTYYGDVTTMILCDKN